VVALRSADDNVEQFDATLEHLVAHRLLTRSAIESEADSQVDIAHEALINGWQQLQQWLKERRQAELTRRQLETKVAHWEGLKRAGGLLDAVELSEAENGLNSPDAKELGYSEGLLTLVRESRAAIEAVKREKEAVRQREFEQAQALAVEKSKAAKKAIGFTVTALLIATVAIFFFIDSKQKGEELEKNIVKVEKQKEKFKKQKDQALRTQSLFLADLARQEKEKSNFTNGILLALEALPKSISNPNRPYVFEAATQLYNSVIRLHEHKVFSGHQDRVYHATFSPNGKSVLTASMDGTARLWDIGGQQKIVFEGHHESIRYAEFSPDGKHIVTASNDKTARLWNANTGKQITILKGHESSVRYATFSPNGQFVITTSGKSMFSEMDKLEEKEDNSARLWEVKTGKQLALFKGHTDMVWQAAFSSDSQRIVTSSRDKTAQLWDVDGKQLAVLEGHKNAVWYATFSPNDQYVVTVSGREHGENRPLEKDYTARLWDANSGKIISVLKGHQSDVFHGAFSPDSKLLVTASFDRTARLWNVEKSELITVLEGHTGEIYHTAFSPDGQHIMTTSRDGTVRLWDINDGKQVAILAGHNGLVYQAAFSPDGQHIVTAGINDDWTARLWNFTTNNQLIVLSDDEQFHDIGISPNGQRLVTVIYNRIHKKYVIHLWDLYSKKQIAILGEHKSSYAGFKRFVVSPNSQLVLTISGGSEKSDNFVHLWDANSGEQITVLGVNKNNFEYATFSPNGQLILTISDDESGIEKSVQLWDVNSGKQLSLLTGNESYVRYANFSPDSQRVVTASWDGTARLWDVNSGKQLAVFAGNEKYVDYAIFSPDGQRILTASNSNSDNNHYVKMSIELWDIKSGEQLTIKKYKGYPSEDLAFSPNGQQLVAIFNLNDKYNYSGTVRLWDANNGKQLFSIKKRWGFANAIFSPDSQNLIISGYDDYNAQLWNVSTGKAIYAMQGHKDFVREIISTLNGKHIITTSNDDTARIWPVFSNAQKLIDYANQIVPRCLTPEQRKQFFLPPEPSYDLIEEGEQLAKQGDIKAATVKFKQAQALAPCHKLFPENKAREIAATFLIEKGKALAKQGKIKEAVEQFKQAQAVDGRFKFGNIEDKVQRIATKTLIEKDRTFVEEKKIEEKKIEMKTPSYIVNQFLFIFSVSS